MFLTCPADVWSKQKASDGEPLNCCWSKTCWMPQAALEISLHLGLSEDEKQVREDFCLFFELLPSLEENRILTFQYKLVIRYSNFSRGGTDKGIIIEHVEKSANMALSTSTLSATV